MAARAWLLGLGALLTGPMLVFEGAAEVRLEGGSWRCAGRVEVKQQGQWGTVCGGYFWDMNDTAVVCKQLGCGSALQAHKEAHFGSGSGPIWMAGVECDGTESALSECTNTEWIREYCDHRWDAGVTCSGFVQLVGGDSPCSGRVEIRDGDQWKTICDSDFGPKAATMVCRELQCGTALSVAGAAHFGEGDGPIWDRELQCVGNESFLASCPRGSPRDKSCSHTKDADQVAQSRFRLVNGSTACEGRVEVQVLGTWGKLCASHWDLLDAHVLCRHLDCGFAESIPRPGHFGRATHPFWRDSFHCDGTEGHLGQCPVTALGALCSQENDAAVICSGEQPCPSPTESFSELGAWLLSPGPADSARQVRLVNGSGRCAGRVEVYHQGSWGTICDDGWDLLDATVICHQLGCGGAVEVVGSAQFGEGSGQIWLDGVNCSGAEDSLWDCPAGSWGQHDCGHKEDAGVICSEFMALRLENSNNCSGRLQVFYNGTWGSVCSNSMTPKTVLLACKELGCGDEGSLDTQRPSGRTSGPTWLDHVQCGERNSSFWQCPSGPWDPQSCDDLQDETHITCNGRRPETSLPSPDREKIRAVGGEDGCSGRVEVWHRGSWGTVCDDSWDMRDAEVACRQLGCGPAVSALHEAAFGMGTGPIWLEQVECRGTEPSLQDCWARPGDSGACRHKEDAAVNCSGCHTGSTVGSSGGGSGAGEMSGGVWDSRVKAHGFRPLGCSSVQPRPSPGRAGAIAVDPWAERGRGKGGSCSQLSTRDLTQGARVSLLQTISMGTLPSLRRW
uniref:SRCR domain-containing protein n=1 Tax=Aquila chrysaetos chrysaetos TaxID=223781 RepID=A0A663EY66_AQUCH